MKNTLSAEQVCTLLRITPAQLWQRYRDGAVGGFVRIDGDSWISSHAAATLVLEGKWDANAQAKADSAVDNADRNMEAAIERKWVAIRKAEKDAADAAAHERWVVLQEREARNREAFGSYLAPGKPTVTVRSMGDA